MNCFEFLDWCNDNGYITCTDWNYQIIEDKHYYFLVNPKIDKFALIEYRPEIIDTGWQAWYKVLVKDWTDYNGWAEKFHEETGGVWK